MSITSSVFLNGVTFDTNTREFAILMIHKYINLLKTKNMISVTQTEHGIVFGHNRWKKQK